VRVIDDTGQQLGIMAPQQALAIARTKGLDLGEIAATAVPPVCRIMDFGRYQYAEQKRARQAKHQKIIEVKEIKFRPKVDEHDYQFKKKHIERFPADGDKVKATISSAAARWRTRDRTTDPGAADRGAGRSGDCGDQSAAGRQSDAHDPVAARRRQAGGAEARDDGGAGARAGTAIGKNVEDRRQKTQYRR
jgi:translation initiation factor IF-3